VRYLVPSPRWERIVPLIFPFPNLIRVRVWEREKGEGNKNVFLIKGSLRGWQNVNIIAGGKAYGEIPSFKVF
jgi:hypothetical protein